MPRYKLLIEYDGTGLVGWQRQDNGESVQGAIEQAIFAFSGEKATLFGAGRTDAGVHARGQVAHFNLEKTYPTHNVMNAINFHVRPTAVAVLSAETVDPEFHARFSAKERSYIYRIINRPAPLMLDGRYALHIGKPLDHKAMHEAAQLLVGKHDFTSFRAKECQSESPVKTLSRIAVTRDADEIQIAVAAPSFLHHMVRNITGTLIEVGIGKWGKQDVREILAAKDRAKAGPTAPAHGLYFMSVVY